MNTKVAIQFTTNLTKIADINSLTRELRQSFEAVPTGLSMGGTVTDMGFEINKNSLLPMLVFLTKDKGMSIQVHDISLIH